MSYRLILRTALALLALFFLSACSLTSDPETVFAKIGLNGNKIPRELSRHFRELRMQKKNGSLQVPTEDRKGMRPGTCVEFVDLIYAQTFDRDIAEIAKLKGDEESKPILEAGLDMFRYADDIYKKDFPKIAQMIDQNRPDAEIDRAVEKLEETRGSELDKKYVAVMKMLIPYADKHGVKYKTIEMP